MEAKTTTGGSPALARRAQTGKGISFRADKFCTSACGEMKNSTRKWQRGVKAVK
jgi:hypothetical protein